MLGELPALLRKETVPDALPELCGTKVTVYGKLCPAASVTGNEIPLTEKPGPFQLALETVTLFELALSVPVMFLLLPTFTVPKLKVVGLMASCPELAPVPTRGTEMLGLFALLDTAILPLSVPLAGGVKLALKVTLCPAGRLIGMLTPLTLKPVPDAATCETWTAVVWLLVKVKGDVLVLLTVTVPKFIEAGLTASCPELAPVPARETERLGLFALLVTAILPLSVPPAGGVKLAFNVTLCPADRLMGRIVPLMLNPVPEATTCEIFTAVVWLFVKVKGRVLVLLTGTLPKFRLAGFAANCP